MGFEGNINATQINNVKQTVNSSNVKILQEGSSVRVVVISDKGNGRYQGSVAGVRVNITSKNPLALGSSFVATVSSKNGVIHLLPQNQVSTLQPQLIVEQNTNQFVQYLSAFGLPQDSLSNSIMFQLKQLGMQFDSDLIRKIYTLAARFKNKEKIAASLISILKEKGIEAAESEIKRMIEEMNFEETDDNSDKKINLGTESELPENQIFNQLLDFIKKLLNDDSDKTGVLTISNHIKRKSSFAGSWIFIPFEVVSGLEEKNVLGKGNLKINLSENDCLNKILLEYFDGTVSRFLLNFEKNQLMNVKMNIQNLSEDLISKKINQLEKKLGVNVEYFLEEELENTAALAEPFYSVGGVV